MTEQSVSLIHPHNARWQFNIVRRNEVEDKALNGHKNPIFLFTQPGKTSPPELIFVFFRKNRSEPYTWFPIWMHNVYLYLLINVFNMFTNNPIWARSNKVLACSHQITILIYLKLDFNKSISMTISHARTYFWLNPVYDTADQSLITRLQIAQNMSFYYRIFFFPQSTLNHDTTVLDLIVRLILLLVRKKDVSSYRIPDTEWVSLKMHGKDKSHVTFHMLAV